MPSSAARRAPPSLEFLASVALRFEAPRAIGETADGVRFDFQVQGSVTGPELNGRFPSCAAYLLIDRDGVGTINVRAPLLLHDGAVAELEAIGRYDFGESGYQRAVALDLPNSALGWCPRLLTGDPRYLWLNRALCLGVGELRPRETRVDYDLFLALPFATPARTPLGQPVAASNPRYAPRDTSLGARLGGRQRVDQIMSASIDSLHQHQQLLRQNPKLAAVSQPTPALKKHVTDYFWALCGGEDVYQGRTMSASHADLDITEADWKLFMEDQVRILSEFGVAAPEQRELLQLMGALKSEIVQRGN